MLHSKKAKLSLGFEAVRNGKYDQHLELLKNRNYEFPELVTALQQISWEEFEELFCRVGEVVTVHQGGEYAGFYWVEVRGRILHLHSFIIKHEYRGRGVGRDALIRLEKYYGDTIDAIELGLHESNQRGLVFYQNEGFEKKDFLEEIGFFILQKSLIGER